MPSQTTESPTPPNGTSKLIRLFGRAPGFMALALAEVGVATYLAHGGGNVEGLATALWPINLGIYGGGGAKALADAWKARGQ